MARRLWPCYSGALDYLRPRQDGLPNGMVIPKPLRFVDGEALGSDAGLLGPRHDPWKLNCNPTDPAFSPENVGLSIGMGGSRIVAGAPYWSDSTTGAALRRTIQRSASSM